MTDRISTLDAGYQTGDLSVYPEAIDNRETLYEARNNAETTLKQTLTYSSKSIIVVNANGFPNQGLIRIGPPPGKSGNYELIYYGSKTTNTFGNLVRGFGGSVQTQWPTNSAVTGGVMAEHHNAVKDALIKIETNLGIKTLPAAESLNAILGELETRFLAPKPIFRSFPLRGTPPLKVRFQNYSGGDPIRWLWDFGDGSSSTETSPTHTYIREGVYSVKLNVITGLGAQGIATKSNYITVSNDEGITFFYANSLTGVSSQTANKNGVEPTLFTFTDQTQGAIVERIWNFDDGTRITVDDGDSHSVTHTYNSPGEYVPTLLTIFDNQRLKRIDLADTIRVS